MGGERDYIYLSLHCHNQNDSCNKMGSDFSSCQLVSAMTDRLSTRSEGSVL